MSGKDQNSNSSSATVDSYYNQWNYYAAQMGQGAATAVEGAPVRFPTTEEYAMFTEAQRIAWFQYYQSLKPQFKNPFAADQNDKATSGQDAPKKKIYDPMALKKKQQKQELASQPPQPPQPPQPAVVRTDSAEISPMESVTVEHSRKFVDVDSSNAENSEVQPEFQSSTLHGNLDSLEPKNSSSTPSAVAPIDIVPTNVSKDSATPGTTTDNVPDALETKKIEEESGSKEVNAQETKPTNVASQERRSSSSTVPTVQPQTTMLKITLKASTQTRLQIPTTLSALQEILLQYDAKIEAEERSLAAYEADQQLKIERIKQSIENRKKQHEIRVQALRTSKEEERERGEIEIRLAEERRQEFERLEKEQEAKAKEAAATDQVLPETETIVASPAKTVPEIPKDIPSEHAKKVEGVLLDPEADSEPTKPTTSSQPTKRSVGGRDSSASLFLPTKEDLEVAQQLQARPRSESPSPDRILSAFGFKRSKNNYGGRRNDAYSYSSHSPPRGGDSKRRHRNYSVERRHSHRDEKFLSERGNSRREDRSEERNYRRHDDHGNAEKGDSGWRDRNYDREERVVPAERIAPRRDETHVRPRDYHERRNQDSYDGERHRNDVNRDLRRQDMIRSNSPTSRHPHEDLRRTGYASVESFLPPPPPPPPVAEEKMERDVMGNDASSEKRRSDAREDEDSDSKRERKSKKHKKSSHRHHRRSDSKSPRQHRRSRDGSLEKS